MADRSIAAGDTLNKLRFEFNGTADVAVDPSRDDNDFKEQKFTVSGLEPFSAFSLKIVLTGTISSYPPLIKDMRGIALAV